MMILMLMMNEYSRKLSFCTHLLALELEYLKTSRGRDGGFARFLVSDLLNPKYCELEGLKN